MFTSICSQCCRLGWFFRRCTCCSSWPYMIQLCLRIPTIIIGHIPPAYNDMLITFLQSLASEEKLVCGPHQNFLSWRGTSTIVLCALDIETVSLGRLASNWNTGALLPTCESSRFLARQIFSGNFHFSIKGQVVRLDLLIHACLSRNSILMSSTSYTTNAKHDIQYL